MVLVSHSGMEAAGMDITTEHIVIGIFSFFSIACGKHRVIGTFLFSIVCGKQTIIDISSYTHLIVISIESAESSPSSQLLVVST
jgi:hypothetical protein